MLVWVIDQIFNSCCIEYSIFYRMILSFFIAFLIALIIGICVIIWFKYLKWFQNIRINGPKSHIFNKQNIPTMGGIIILISIIISVVLLADLSNMYIWYILFILVMYGILGAIDDYLKIKKISNGLSIRCKYFWQSLIAFILIIVMCITDNDISIMKYPSESFYINILPRLDIFFYYLLAYFVIVGTSNAVNLSDGLDGLVIIPIILVTFGLSLVSWLTSNIYFSSYLHIPYIDLARELIIVCSSIIGASIGFLWFNAHPAQIFMGDVGSLSLGGVLGLISILLHQECLLFIMGGVFVIESLSVIFQVVCFKFFGKRIFKMAPLHHHFELNGCPENKVIVRFWIVSLILVLIGLMVLKFLI